MNESFPGINNISLESMEQERMINSLSARFETQKKLYQPNPEDFFEQKGFDKEKIQEEIEKAKQLKEKWEEQSTDFEKEQKKLAGVLEGIIVDQFCGDWLANKAEAFFTAEPDDYLRKVDCVVEFKPTQEERPEYLGLGIDVTFSSDEQNIKNKLEHIWSKDIKKESRTELMYVETDHHKGSLLVSRVVLAAQKETVFELARLYKNKDTEGLNNHPYLASLLFQIKTQLESYILYSRSKNVSPSYIRSLEKTLGTFYAIVDEKEDFLTTYAQEHLQKDTSYAQIKSFCDEKLAK